MVDIHTPLDLGIKEETVIPPEGGWEEQSFYICDVAVSAYNVIHSAIFFTGFLDDGKPGAYNSFASFTHMPEHFTMYNVYYMKAIKKIAYKGDGYDDIHSC